MGSPTSTQLAPQAYVLENNVTHARILPASSAHSFNYPTVALFISLRALESHALDLARGWVFGYGGTRARLTGLKAGAYLYADASDGRSILEKLKCAVKEHVHDGEDIDDAWMLTMPSYLGFEGINPLTVYFCYSANSELLYIVLEIHNTFLERHVHVLVIGKSEDTPPVGFSHSWTFPRQFHVSPFNDRSGCYTCSVVAPTHHPSQSHSPLGKIPLPTVRIQLHTAPTPNEPKPRLKLTATLRPLSATPLTSRALLRTLARYPFTLLLSFARIAYHAAILHYWKRLDVFIRPEPVARSSAVERRLPDASNAAQDMLTSEGTQGIFSGGVGWQDEGLLERYSRGIVEQFLERRANETGLSISLEYTDPFRRPRTFRPSNADGAQDSSSASPHSRALHITSRSPRTFTSLLAAPSAAHFLLVAHDAERIVGLSSDALFLRVFAPSAADTRPYAWLHRWLSKARELPVPAILLPQDKEAHLQVPPASAHPLDTPSSLGLLAGNLLCILTLHFLTALEYCVFSLVRARFVEGDEPWGAWQRAESVFRRSHGDIISDGTRPAGRGNFGSVRRD